VWDAVKRVIQLAPHADPSLTHREFRVLLYLADRLNRTTGQLNPSPERLALDLGLKRTAERSIRQAIDGLERKGWVQRVGSSKGGQEPGGHYPTQRYLLRADVASPLPGCNRVDVASEQGGRGVRNRVDVATPEPRKLEPRKTNLPSGSTTRLASPPTSGDASAATPTRGKGGGRISDALLAQVRELDPDAERRTRHDGSEWIELSDGEPLPNAQRAAMWLRYSPDARY
jgi:hypothetical protein